MLVASFLCRITEARRSAPAWDSGIATDVIFVVPSPDISLFMHCLSPTKDHKRSLSGCRVVARAERAINNLESTARLVDFLTVERANLP